MGITSSFLPQVGPGAVHIELDNSLFKGLIIQNVTPLGPLRQKLLHQFYISWHIPMVFAKAFYYLETVQVGFIFPTSFFNVKLFRGKERKTKRKTGV